MKEKALDRPVIIVGAARSGTNMLRDILTRLPDFATWNCDEINYIWRHGNIHYPNDEFPPDLASTAVKSYIRKQFLKVARRYQGKMVVEKTCANSLRVGFVNKVIPEARFIFLCRDGRDAVVSSRKRWMASLDIRYIMRKARYVPFPDVPYYANRYLKNRIHKLISKEKRLSSWGPRFKGMNEMVRKRSLLEVCAMQWVRCVEKSLEGFAVIDSSRIFTLKYEDFVTNPAGYMYQITEFLGVRPPRAVIRDLVREVNSKSVGSWKREFSSTDLKVIRPSIETPLRRLGYI